MTTGWDGSSRCEHRNPPARCMSCKGPYTLTAPQINKIIRMAMNEASAAARCGEGADLDVLRLRIFDSVLAAGEPGRATAEWVEERSSTHEPRDEPDGPVPYFAAPDQEAKRG